MELGVLVVSGSEKAIDEHCKKMATLKERCLTVLKKTSSVLRFATRGTMTINMLEGGRYALL
jgi:hypothetical protein